jgi:pilus assembly protein CpaE
LSNLLELVPKSINDQQVSSRLLPSSNGLRVLVGPQQLKEYREPQVEQIEALLNTMVRMAEFVVVDLPHMPSLANRTVLRMAHAILLVLEPEVSSLMAAQALLELCGAWTISPASIKPVVVNRVQAAQTVGIADIERGLGIELMGMIPAAADVAAASLKAGSPMLISAGNAVAVGALQEIVSRVGALRAVGSR